MAILLQDAGNGVESQVQSHHGGSVQLQLTGNFDGGTVQVQVSQDGLTFTTLIQTTPFTIPDVNDIKLTKGSNWKLVVAGAGGAASISASAII